MEAIRQPFSLSVSKTLRIVPALLLALGMTACGEESSGTLNLNKEDGLVIHAPSFLQSRAIVQANLEARVTVTVDGQDVPVTPTSSSSTRWVGQVFVPPDSNPTISVMWVETQVENLAERNGVLPLAIYTSTLVNSVEASTTVAIPVEEYDVRSTTDRPYPELDLDGDGAGNLQERQIGSDPNDAGDIPQSVNILYVNGSPRIDGFYDEIWNSAQFLDVDRSALNIDEVLLDNNVVQPDENRQFKWAGMHDGEYLYLFIFGEAAGMQTPFADSTNVYEDDSVDIYWDTNNSKGARYDRVDDSHVMIGLLSGSGIANNSSTTDARFQIGFNSAPVAVGTIDYAICVCVGSQQTYEIRINLAASGIPVDQTFGFELNVNNDVDGDGRDAKWAWFNTSGRDDSWEFPGRMGNVRLQAVP